MLLNCGVGEDAWESLGLQGDPTSPSWGKSVLNIHWKDCAEAETPILWPPDAKSWHTREDPDAGKDWRQLEKTLERPLDCRRSNQSILKEISPGISLEGMTLKLKLQYLATWCKELIHLKRPWCWERLRAGGEEDDRGWDGWMVSQTRGTWVWVSSGSWWWTGRPDILRFMGSQRVRQGWETELNWTAL